MTETLREIAIRITNEEDAQISCADTAVLVLGNSTLDKPALIARWLGRNPPSAAKRAPGLEYSWSRKSNKICHVWELPEVITPSLLHAILRPKRQFKSTIILVVLDLSRPNTLAAIAQDIFSALATILPFPVYIIGGKYDIFQNLDSEIKKQVCKFLRGVALIYSTTLLFYSNEMPALTKRIGEVLNSLVWGLPASRASITKDHHAPLYIPVNQDSWDELGMQQCDMQRLIDNFNRQFRQY